LLKKTIIQCLAVELQIFRYYLRKFRTGRKIGERRLCTGEPEECIDNHRIIMDLLWINSTWN